MKTADVHKVVQDGYSKIARKSISCCGGPNRDNRAWSISEKIGYTARELASVPGGANLGLGCGNPVGLASLKKGETVLDLGSGAGLDCFLAAQKVGKTGKVIGVDMTPDMIHKARENARKTHYRNVEFRLGEIENLPCADNSVDVIISNCVINLSPDKERVFQEAFRVLRPGGRLMVSDIVLTKPLPAFIRKCMAAYVGCLSGAWPMDKYVKAIRSAGFNDVRIVEESSFPLECIANDPRGNAILGGVKISKKKLAELADSIRSIKVHGVKAPQRF